MESLVKIFKALSDKHRLHILKILEVRDFCVCEITELLQLANSTVSKHLSILKEAGFIEDYRDGKWVYYKLKVNPEDFRIKQLMAFVPYWLDNDPEVEKMNSIAYEKKKNDICKI